MALMAVGTADAAVGVQACDRLAANPPDPDRVTAGVEQRDVDVPAAIAACEAAVADFPEEARFSYQLGRVYFYDGQTQAALKSFQQAIDLNYRQAKFLLGIVMTQGYDGVPDDICRVESLWRSAAEQNHHNAQLSYVQFAVMGRFNACETVATRAEMSDFLDAAGPQLYAFGGVSLDYLGGLLIANLRADLNNMPDH